MTLFLAGCYLVDAALRSNDLVPDWRLLSCKITFFLKEAAGINNDLVPDLRLHG